MTATLRKRLVLLAIASTLTSCGVKGPPVAPEYIPEKSTKAPECTPYDPECAETDKKYVAGLDPENPKDAALIEKLKAEYRKRRAQEANSSSKTNKSKESTN